MGKEKPLSERWKMDSKDIEKALNKEANKNGRDKKPKKGG